MDYAEKIIKKLEDFTSDATKGGAFKVLKTQAFGDALELAGYIGINVAFVYGLYLSDPGAFNRATKKLEDELNIKLSYNVDQAPQRDLEGCGELVDDTPFHTKDVAKDAKSYLELGQTSLERHKYTDALYHFSKAIEIDPSNPDAYFGRGIANLFLLDREGGDEDGRTWLRLKGVPLKR